MKTPFAPTPVRIMAIIQLCLAFSLLMWAMGEPFLGDVYLYKSRAVLYEAVIEDTEHFDQLPTDQRSEILRNFEHLQDWSNGTFWEKCQRSFRIAYAHLPPFLQSWIIFSIAISLMILLRIEAIERAAWILPLIVALYAFDNRWNGLEDSSPNLFPTEQYLVETYLDEPPSGSVSTQREQLLKGWHLYLINEWAKETPSIDPNRFALHLKQGQFNFNLARVQSLPKLTPKNQIALYHQKESPFVLLLYFLWNLLFAWFVNRRWD